MTFEMDPRLSNDTIALTDWGLSSVALMNDARYPWLVLIPRRQALYEWIDLPEYDQQTLMIEINRAAQVLRKEFQPHKINIASLGNIVPQLHVHIVARFKHDAVWPYPVWAAGEREPYSPELQRQRIEALRAALA